MGVLKNGLVSSSMENPFQNGIIFSDMLDKSIEHTNIDKNNNYYHSMHYNSHDKNNID
jgi:hypothetical protein